MAWATTADVLELTDVTVTTGAVTRAQHVIETLIGRTEAAAGANIKPSDARKLGNAVAYQAAYMTAHPELLTATDVASIAQPDLSVTYRGTGDEPAQLVSPMARLALRTVSFIRPRSIAGESWTTDPDRDGDDDNDEEHGTWQPI